MRRHVTSFFIIRNSLQRDAFLFSFKTFELHFTEFMYSKYEIRPFQKKYLITKEQYAHKTYIAINSKCTIYFQLTYTCYYIDLY